MSLHDLASPEQIATVSQEIYSNFVSLTAEPGFAQLPFEIGHSAANAKWVIGVAATSTTLFLFKNTSYEDMSATVQNGEVEMRLEDRQQPGRPLTIPRGSRFLLEAPEPKTGSLSYEPSLVARALLRKLGASPDDKFFDHIDGLIPHATIESYSGTAHWSDPDPSGVRISAGYTFYKGPHPEARRYFSIYPANKTWGFSIASSVQIGTSFTDSRYEIFQCTDVDGSPQPREGIWYPAALTPDRLQEVYETTLRSIANGRSMARAIEDCSQKVGV